MGDLGITIRFGLVLALPMLIAPVVASAQEFDLHLRPSIEPQSDEVSLDVGAGSTLGKVMSDLGAEVDWWRESFANQTVSGNFSGSREAIASRLLEEFSYAIFREHSRMRVVVPAMSMSPKAHNPPARPRVFPSKNAPEMPHPGGMHRPVQESGV